MAASDEFDIIRNNFSLMKHSYNPVCFVVI